MLELPQDVDLPADVLELLDLRGPLLALLLRGSRSQEQPGVAGGQFRCSGPQRVWRLRCSKTYVTTSGCEDMRVDAEMRRVAAKFHGGKHVPWDRETVRACCPVLDDAPEGNRIILIATCERRRAGRESVPVGGAHGPRSALRLPFKDETRLASRGMRWDAPGSPFQDVWPA